MKFLELEGKQKTVKITKISLGYCVICEERLKEVYVAKEGEAICEDCINQLAEIIK